MPRETIDSDTFPGFFPKLKELAAWLSETKEFEEEQPNLSRCVDENRHGKIRPVLRELGYDQIKGRGYKIWRITGKVSIKNTLDYNTLFFPLSIGSGPESIASGEIQIAGETLTPGCYIPITRTLTVDGQLDCLIVLLPNQDGSPTTGNGDDHCYEIF
ncbi:uncharacterized protein N7459_000898 [Penicillium hispanicum]|uniref:uncharacterized protein n=1 Tax=Penicillium hispanicum TaxID=1080232 RepID=UPI00253FF4B6|nr:uncharacterized protein N7459_000898 [Penicillium hispanicum]KAJ5594690.1 hypothetical protein N7459_000898 [Penicillium hispanicum]